MRFAQRLGFATVLISIFSGTCFAQKAPTWRDIKDSYLQQATRVRDTIIGYSYQRGAASLLDFLNAQADYRSVQVSYLNLVASYLDAAGQLNLAVGREVIQ
jgi:cobalt-zinc-cadmium efflux system outer membrane protein